MDVAPQSGGQPVRDDLDDAAEGVAVLLLGVDLGDHRRGRGLVHRPDRGGVDALAVAGHRDRALGGVGGAQRHHVGEDLDAECLGEERLGDRAERLFQDRGQAARLVPGRGVVVHRLGVGLPPADPLDEAFADRA